MSGIGVGCVLLGYDIPVQHVFHCTNFAIINAIGITHSPRILTSEKIIQIVGCSIFYKHTYISAERRETFKLTTYTRIIIWTCLSVNLWKLAFSPMWFSTSTTQSRCSARVFSKVSWSSAFVWTKKCFTLQYNQWEWWDRNPWLVTAEVRRRRHGRALGGAVGKPSGERPDAMIHVLNGTMILPAKHCQPLERFDW